MRNAVKRMKGPGFSGSSSGPSRQGGELCRFRPYVAGHYHSRPEERVQSPWKADTSAAFSRRLGRSAQDLGLSSSSSSCPDFWELENGDYAMIGTDATDAYARRLPHGVSLALGERLVILPGPIVRAAKSDIPDA